MAGFDRAIRFVVYGTFGYITAVMGQNWYYNKRLSRFGKDIYKLDPDGLAPNEKEEYQRLRTYFDEHMGRQILDNLHSTKYLGDKVKQKLNELEVQRINILNSVVGQKDKREIERVNAQIREIDKEIHELNDFKNRVRKERFYDMFPDEDPEKIN